MEKYTDLVLVRNGQSLLPQPGASVLVQNSPSGTLATIYSDNGITVTPNPLTTDGSGRFSFYAPDGRYSLIVSYGNVSYSVLDFPLEFDPGASTGSASVVFQQSESGSAIRTVQSKLKESISLLDASGDGVVTDYSAALNTALGWAATAGGLEIHIPAGAFSFASGPFVIPVNTVIRGAGKNATTLTYSGTGDFFQSTHPINSSTAANIAVLDLTIACSAGSNTGAGFDEVGGTFIYLSNVKISGFADQVIFDQTEIALVERCELVRSGTQNGIWLLNGPEHTTGANGGFTNRITVRDTQFNASAGASGINIVDDGGVTHVFDSNNWNGALSADTGIRAANVFGLVITGNESERHSTPVYLTDTRLSGAYVGGCGNPKIEGNTFTDICVAHIGIDAAVGGSIRANTFGQATSSNIAFNRGAACACSGLEISGNSKLVTGSFRQSAPFINGFSVPLRANKLAQTPHTFVTAAQASAGSQTVTPATMEGIHPGTRLLAVNPDGTNPESIIVKSTTGTTFIAVFASTKQAFYILQGITRLDEEEGTWTPVLAGNTTPGSNTYSTQGGNYSRRGNLVNLTGFIVISAKDASMAGNLLITGLPFAIGSQTSGGFIFGTVGFWTGFTFTGFTQMGLDASTGGTSAQLAKMGSGQSAGISTASDIPGTTLSLGFSLIYQTDSL